MNDRTQRLRPLLPTNADSLPPEGIASGYGTEPASPPRRPLSDAAGRGDEADDAATPAAGGSPAQDPYVAFALRWWWLLILGALIGGGIAFGYTRYGPVPLQSTAQVQVPAQTTNDPTANSGQARSAATNYAAEATSPQMYALVSKALEGKLDLSATDLQLLQQAGQLDVRLVRNTNLISITVTDPDPARARLIADTFAATFVRDVNNRAATQLDARGLQLQEQIRLTQDRLLVAQLQQRAEKLRAELVTQRGLLLQLQLGYQQELQRQAEADRLAVVNGQPTSAQVFETRAAWLKLIRDQVAAMQATLDDLSRQLDEVQATLKGLPANTDPSVSAAFTTAYSEQLQSLTREFAQLQIGGPGARTPLVRYGEASDPLAANGRKKLLMMGLAAGVALMAGLGFLIDLLRQRRGGAEAQGRDGAGARRRWWRRAKREADATPPAPIAEPLATATGVATQRPPDLVPLPMHARPETPDVRWRRASGN